MKRKILILAGWTAALVLLGFTVWYKLMRREVAQPAWVSETKQNLFLYGSVGANQDSGIPYWVWLTMPRIFPEHMPGNGGYVALGSSWEEGREMPAGFAKRLQRVQQITGSQGSIALFGQVLGALNQHVARAFATPANEDRDAVAAFEVGPTGGRTGVSSGHRRHSSLLHTTHV